MARKHIHVHVHDVSTPYDFNSGLRLLSAAWGNGRLPPQPTAADIANAESVLRKARNDIDGMLVILRGINAR